MERSRTRTKENNSKSNNKEGAKANKIVREQKQLKDQQQKKEYGQEHETMANKRERTRPGTKAAMTRSSKSKKQ